MTAERGDPESVERLRQLARHLSLFESPDFRFGHWVRPFTDADGVIHVGWYEPTPEAEAFLTDARAMVAVFDWPAWSSSPEGRALMKDPAAVASASADDLAKLLTTYIRAERFGDGTLESAFRSGMLSAIVRRASVLAADR